MSDLEKLAAIRARCVELLELAGKRTPGKWGVEQTEYANYVGPMRTRGDDKIETIIVETDRDRIKPEYLKQNDSNASFIASCAGPAEAGWRATIAAIDALEAAHIALPELDNTAWDGLRSILAAWEGQV